MIDKWFIDDINKAAAGEGRVVVTRCQGRRKIPLELSSFSVCAAACSQLRSG